VRMLKMCGHAEAVGLLSCSLSLNRNRFERRKSNGMVRGENMGEDILKSEVCLAFAFLERK
jgi:hypothetical protein